MTTSRRHGPPVFRLALAAAALSVLDDAFWHRLGRPQAECERL